MCDLIKLGFFFPSFEENCARVNCCSVSADGGNGGEGNCHVYSCSVQSYPIVISPWERWLLNNFLILRKWLWYFVSSKEECTSFLPHFSPVCFSDSCLSLLPPTQFGLNKSVVVTVCWIVLWIIAWSFVIDLVRELAFTNCNFCTPSFFHCVHINQRYLCIFIAYSLDINYLFSSDDRGNIYHFVCYCLQNRGSTMVVKGNLSTWSAVSSVSTGQCYCLNSSSLNVCVRPLTCLMCCPWLRHLKLVSWASWSANTTMAHVYVLAAGEHHHRG